MRSEPVNLPPPAESHLAGRPLNGHNPDGPHKRVRIGVPTVCCCTLVVFALLTAVALKANGPLSVDRQIFRWVVAHRTNSTVGVAKALSAFADPAILGPVSLAVTGLLYLGLIKRRLSSVRAFAPVAALTVGTALQMVIKPLVGRSRPPVAYHLANEADLAFPSGHTTGAAAFLVAVGLILTPFLLGWARRVALLLPAVVAMLVGASRVVLGVHWATDVLGGWMLGVACATGAVLVARLVEDRLRPRHPTAGAPTPTLTG